MRPAGAPVVVPGAPANPMERMQGNTSMIEYVAQGLLIERYLAAACSPEPPEAPRHPGPAPGDGEERGTSGAPAIGTDAPAPEHRPAGPHGTERRMRARMGWLRAARAGPPTGPEGADR